MAFGCRGEPPLCARACTPYPPERAVQGQHLVANQIQETFLSGTARGLNGRDMDRRMGRLVNWREGMYPIQWYGRSSRRWGEDTGAIRLSAPWQGPCPPGWPGMMAASVSRLSVHPDPIRSHPIVQSTPFETTTWPDRRYGFVAGRVPCRPQDDRLRHPLRRSCRVRRFGQSSRDLRQTSARSLAQRVTRPRHLHFW